MPALMNSNPSSCCVVVPLEVSVVPVLDTVDPVDDSCCDVVTLDVSAVLVVVVVLLVVSEVAEFRSVAADSEPPAPALDSVTMPYTTGCGVHVGSVEGSPDVEGTADIEGKKVSLARCLLPIIGSKS